MDDASNGRRSQQDPDRFELADGSVLALAIEDDGRRTWARMDGAARTPLSVSEAMDAAGDGLAGRVRARSCAEREWLGMLAEWARARAEVVDGELDAARES